MQGSSEGQVGERSPASSVREGAMLSAKPRCPRSSGEWTQPSTASTKCKCSDASHIRRQQEATVPQGNCPAVLPTARSSWSADSILGEAFRRWRRCATEATEEGVLRETMVLEGGDVGREEGGRGGEEEGDLGEGD